MLMFVFTQHACTVQCTLYRVYFLYKFKRYLNCYFVPEVMGSHGTLCSVFKEDENVVYSYIGDPQIGADENSQLCVYVGEVSSHILIIYSRQTNRALSSSD